MRSTTRARAGAQGTRPRRVAVSAAINHNAAPNRSGPLIARLCSHHSVARRWQSLSELVADFAVLATAVNPARLAGLDSRARPAASGKHR
jgi:hypothetical protein